MGLKNFCGRCWVEVNLGALRENALALKRLAGASCGLLAVVKSNAYGHGAREVCQTIADLVECFGVASVEEARELVVFGRDIMLLSPCLPCERPEAVEAGWIPTVSSANEAASYAKIGRCRVNFKIDTGMGRLGCDPTEAEREISALAAISELSVYSISTHMPVADEDDEFSVFQLEKFWGLRERLERLVPEARWHVLNSAGLMKYQGSAMDLVRCGLALYGIAYPGEFQGLLCPVLTWKARILMTKWLPEGASVSYGRTFIAPSRMRVASLSVGYGDGYPRQASGRGACVLVGGQRRPILGRVTMDQIMVDVGGLDVEPGDEVVLIGGQAGERILASELASWSDTIAWNIFTGISSRVKRIYFLRDDQTALNTRSDR